MPELPEVECVRRSLERHVLGRRVSSVRVTRPDIIVGKHTPDTLLTGQRIAQVIRHGKQLALVADTGRCVAVHLGMSGQLCLIQPQDQPQANKPPKLPPHTHVLWRFEEGLLMRFTDPRRFGGLWTFDQREDLHSLRWARLGPDALLITPSDLHRRLFKTKRPLKAALLNQNLVAGLGNIYVDELLFGIGLHPLWLADQIDALQAAALVRRMRTLLSGAISRGGSTLRDYVDAENKTGTQQHRHKVYGRSGLGCKRRGCGAQIVSDQVAGRTTAWCPRCQAQPT